MNHRRHRLEKGGRRGRTTANRLTALIGLSRRLGDPALRMAILGEGNASARVDGGTFLVKASGSTLESLGESDVVECRAEGLLALLDREERRRTTTCSRR